MNAPTDAAAELKPCPFCGGEAYCEAEPDIETNTLAAFCTKCGTCGPYIDAEDGGRSEAIAAWNTRPPTDAAAVREAAARKQGEGRHAYIRDVGPALAPEHRSVAMAAYDAGWTDSAAAIRQLDRSGGDEVERLLRDPSFVHLNMLRGGIAKPTITNIIHLYGRDALLEALTPARVERSGEGGGA